MKTPASGAFALILLMSLGLEARSEEPETKSISVESLDTIAVIGKLGVPLGEVVTIRATIVDGDTLRRKAAASSYFLKVTEVNGQALKAGPILDFGMSPGSTVKLATNNFDLYELKKGEKTGQLTTAEIEKLRKGYVGKTLTLQVYESGGFSGIPKNLPEKVMVWQDRGFGFETHLIVLCKEKAHAPGPKGRQKIDRNVDALERATRCR